MKSTSDLILKFAHDSGFMDCIDDVYLERGDWRPLVERFAALMFAAGIEAAAKIVEQDLAEPEAFRYEGGELAQAIRLLAESPKSALQTLSDSTLELGGYAPTNDEKPGQPPKGSAGPG